MWAISSETLLSQLGVYLTGSFDPGDGVRMHTIDLVSPPAQTCPPPTITMETTKAEALYKDCT